MSYVPSNFMLNKKVTPGSSRVQRQEIAPQNSNTAALGTKTIINIPTGDGQYSNFQNSYLRMTGTFTAGANGATIRMLEVGAHAFIRKCLVKCGSSTWESNHDNYAVLAKQIYELQMSSPECLDKNNILLGTRSDFAIDLSGNSLTSFRSPSVRKINSGDLIMQNADAATVVVRTFCIPLLSVFGLLWPSDKYFPLHLCKASNITLELTLQDSIARCCLVDASTHTLSFSNIAYVMETINLDEASHAMVLSENLRVSGGELSMPFVGVDLITQTFAVQANATINFSIPAKFTSLKGLIVCQRDTNNLGQPRYMNLSSILNGVVSYQWRIGGVLYPQSPVASVPEMFGELIKVFGSIADHNYTPNIDLPSYTLNASSQAPAVGATEFYQGISSASFLIGLDLEAFPSSNKDRLYAGANTQLLDIFLILNYGPTNVAVSSPNTVTLDCYAYSDKKLIFSNGLGYIET
jgi:hypothetical protein